MATIDEYKKFVNSAPTNEREFRTIELYHPDFSQLLRFVQDFVDRDLTLESTAPRNPSELVTFTAISMVLTEAGENGQVEQILSVDLGAVGNEVNGQISQIVDTFVPVQLIYRKFYSGDLTEPVIVMTLSVSDVSFKSYESVSFTGEDTDFSAKRAGELYTLERFPGLKGS